jgi:hypothetical protein
MLTLWGNRYSGDCDRIPRRDFLRVGALAMGGAALPQILQAEARAGQSPRAKQHKAVIMVFLAGGPPHQDMVDLKPNAPEGIRGEFKPIETNVPGIQICEHMPRLAQRMDQLAIIRSIVGLRDEHSSTQCFSGYNDQLSRVQGGRPALGSILSYLHGPVDPAVPPYVGLTSRCQHSPWGDPGGAGYLGLPHSPYTPFMGEQVDLARQGISVDRLDRRKSLFQQLDDFRSRFDAAGSVEGMEAFDRAAFEILTSSKLLNALDVSREDPRLRAKYGIGDMKFEFDGPPTCMDHFLMARRLVEAGARCVTIAFGRWDTHSDNFGQNKVRMAKLDQGLSALLDDLKARGLDQDVSVVVWGEFGRTPRINKDAGRDHWSPVSMAILAGGGIKAGQVIGSTEKDAGHAKDRPIHFQQVFATLYHNLGIDPADTTVPDKSGRPMYLLERQNATPIRELV